MYILKIYLIKKVFFQTFLCLGVPSKILFMSSVPPTKKGCEHLPCVLIVQLSYDIGLNEKPFVDIYFDVSMEALFTFI
jgi:hypothetical protein